MNNNKYIVALVKLAKL